MIARSLTVLSGAMLLLAAQAFAPARAQENPPAVPDAPGDARTEAQERAAAEPAVTQPVASDPPAADPAQGDPAAGDAAMDEPAAGDAESPQPATTTGAAPPAPGAASARFRTMDRLELESTAITGNRELPKVLYIVPWKKADLGDLIGRPANSLLDEVLTPVDRDVFRRQTEYYQKLEGTAPAPGNGPQPPSQPQSEQKSPPAPAPR